MFSFLIEHGHWLALFSKRLHPVIRVLPFYQHQTCHVLLYFNTPIIRSFFKLDKIPSLVLCCTNLNLCCNYKRFTVKHWSCFHEDMSIKLNWHKFQLIRTAYRPRSKLIGWHWRCISAYLSIYHGKDQYKFT